jgi:hypothetical protein
VRLPCGGGDTNALEENRSPCFDVSRQPRGVMFLSPGRLGFPGQEDVDVTPSRIFTCFPDPDALPGAPSFLSHPAFAMGATLAPLLLIVQVVAVSRS